MRGRSRGKWGGPSVLAIFAVIGVVYPAPSFAQAVDALPPSRKPMAFSVPLVADSGPLGEVAITVGDQVRVDGPTLIKLLAPLLSPEGASILARTVGEVAFVAPETLADIGIELVFDQSRLEVLVVSIPPDLRKVQQIGGLATHLSMEKPTVPQAGFSAFLNLAANMEYLDSLSASGFRKPDVIGYGAIRKGAFALQYEGGLSETGIQQYGFYRRFVRGIYDFEERDLRASAGDLQTSNLSILGSQLIGGVGIERSRRIYEPFDPVYRLGGRQLRIDSPSTIEIVRNGETIDQIPVDQGLYDLDDLPLTSGYNDVQIIVRDAGGRETVTGFDYFYDPVDLAVGDYEYGGYVGFVSDLQSISPNYGRQIAATGYYRRAFTASLLLGVGAQASSKVQASALEAVWVPQFVPGSFQAEFATSNGTRGVGFAGRLGYRLATGTRYGGQQFSLLADFESTRFELVGRPTLFNERRLSVTASYGRSLSPRTNVTAGANLFKRGDRPTRKAVFADLSHQFRAGLRGTAGVEWGENDGYGSSFGARIGLTWAFGRNSRADASYESRRNLLRAGVGRSLENRAGSLGYDLLYQKSEQRSSADASLRYRANRFDSRLLVSGYGDGLGNVFDERRAQLQLSTSLAYADGVFGVGRTIGDGFALVRPHPSIDAEVMVGDNLNEGEYQGRSGWLGAAVVPNISAYQTRDVVYDVDTVNTVFDTGRGTDKVRVAEGGGAVIEVGSSRFISAMGTLDDGNEPVGLVSGRVTSETDRGFQPQPFFTNSVGRFAVIGLAPGESYRVELKDGRTFAIDVPYQKNGLYRMGVLTIEGTAQ